MDEVSFGYAGERFYEKIPGGHALYRVPTIRTRILPTNFMDAPIAIAVFERDEPRDFPIYFGRGPYRSKKRWGFVESTNPELVWCSDLLELHCRIEELIAKNGWWP